MTTHSSMSFFFFLYIHHFFILQVFAEGSHPLPTGIEIGRILRRTTWKIIPKLHNLMCILMPEIPVSRVYLTGDTMGTWVFFFYWRLITLQYCGGFLPYIDMNEPRVYMCPLILNPLPSPSLSNPSRLSQSTDFECSVSCIKFTLVIYLHLVIYMIQCYSLKSSHPHFLPHSPKVCSCFSVLHIGSLLPSF